ncbi:transposase [Parafrankia sp. CH37]|uniref:transposase n=1 Tax=Parafrankia sp. CH37 TaxID=683308 RepID=UPI000DF2A6C0|nr:transposase [Parafrankia sp. CH37]
MPTGADRRCQQGPDRTGWQRCPFHFQRNVAVRVSKHAASMVTAAIKTSFAPSTAKLVRAQVDTVADLLARKLPAVEGMLRDAKADLTAFADSPNRTGARSGRTTYWNGCTEAPTSGASRSGQCCSVSGRSYRRRGREAGTSKARPDRNPRHVGVISSVMGGILGCCLLAGSP